jgi:TonB family protein
MLLMSAGALQAGSRVAAVEDRRPQECKQPLVVEKAVAPSFPPLAIRAQTYGTVNVAIEVGDNGGVVKAEIATGSTELSLFHGPALAAAKKWSFTSAYGCNSRSGSLQFKFRKPVPADWGSGTIFKPPFRIEIVVEEVEMPTESQPRP